MFVLHELVEMKDLNILIIVYNGLSMCELR